MTDPFPRPSPFSCDECARMRQNQAHLVQFILFHVINSLAKIKPNKSHSQIVYRNPTLSIIMNYYQGSNKLIFTRVLHLRNQLLNHFTKA